MKKNNLKNLEIVGWTGVSLAMLIATILAYRKWNKTKGNNKSTPDAQGPWSNPPSNPKTPKPKNPNNLDKFYKKSSRLIGETFSNSITNTTKAVNGIKNKLGSFFGKNSKKNQTNQEPKSSTVAEGKSQQSTQVKDVELNQSWITPLPPTIEEKQQLQKMKSIIWSKMWNQQTLIVIS